MISEVLIVLNIKVMVSYDMMPLSANISDKLAGGSFGVEGGSSLFLQNVGSHLPTAWCHVTEDHSLNAGV
jgi:hypothetical protein